VRRYSFYHPDTGLFTAKILATTNPALVALNTPEGYRAIAGAYDHLSQRVDLGTLKVIDYQPPRPSPQHEWNPKSRRWELAAAVIAQRQLAAQALSEIARLEATQARPMRELALDPANVAAHARLAAIDAQIVELRKRL